MRAAAILLGLLPCLWSQPVAVTALNPSPLQVETGVTVTVTGPGEVRIDHAGSGGTLSFQLPSPLSVVPCPGGEGSCLETTRVTARHTIAGMRQVSILVNFSCSGPVSGFGFVADSTFTCPVSGARLDSQNRVGISVLVTLQHFLGDPTRTANLSFNWQVAVPGCPATDERQAKAARQADSCQPLTISPSVATNSLNAPYAQRGIAGAFRATIRGSNFPASGTVSLGSDFVVDRADFKSSTEIEVMLSGFGDLKEGPRDVVITGPSGSKITGKDAFFISSLLIRMEINQGVPMPCDLKRPCIADHNTIVRVQIECNLPKANGDSCSTGKERVTGRLNLYKNGTLFALSPFKPKKRLRVTSGGGYDEATRQAGKDALNYFFTLGNIGLLQEGLYSFEFQIDPRKPDVFPDAVPAGDLLSASAVTSDGTSVLSFKKSTKEPDHEPRGRTRASTPAGGVRIALAVDPGDRAKVTDAQLLQWVEFVRATYPASRDLIQAEVVPNGIPWQAQESADKREDATLGLVAGGLKLGLYGRPTIRQAGAPTTRYTHLMYFSTAPLDNGWSQCGPGSFLGNLPGPEVFRCWGMGSVVLLQEVSRKVTDDTMRTLPHELGHHFWFGDTYTAAGFQRNPKLPEQNAGECDYGDGCAVEAGHMDTVLGTVSVRPFANDLAERRKMVKRDFMGNSDRPFRWVNLFNWNYLYPQFNDLPQAVGTNSAPKRPRSIGLPADAESVDFIEVRGWLNQANAVKFLPALRGNGILPGPSPGEAGLPPASYTVEIQDGSGQTLAADGFDPIFQPVHRATPMDQATFDVTLRLYPGSSRIVVKKQGEVVATRAITPNPPTVQIVSPSPGATLSGVTKVSWNGADIDGDTLTYSVLYSADGENWFPMAVDLNANQLDIDTALLPGGKNGAILVIANDGANSASAVTGSLTLPAKAPQVAVFAPGDGEIFEEGEMVTIYAPVLDADATGTKVVLKSDRDGALGDGPTLSTKALSVGRHRLTATATNSAGLSSESAITIVIAAAADSTAESPTTIGPGAGEGGSGSGTEAGTQTRITPLIARGWPNERNYDNPPPNAVDGKTDTFTWTTNPNNVMTPSFFGVDFGSAKPVSRIRLFKDNDGGGGTRSDFFKNLTIEYTTTSASTAMESRTWTRVTGLANGYNGAELLTAAAVNADGTVTRDSHNSLTNGWASLTFNAVNATGVRIGFANETSPAFFNHYKVHEFEAYGPASTSPGLQFSLNGIDAGGRVNFLSVTVRTTATVTLTARNAGTAAVTVNSITSSNPLFSADPQSFTLPPNGTGALNIRFAPTAEGAQQGVLTLNLAGGATVTLNVSGTGVAASGGGGATGTSVLQNGGADAASVTGCSVPTSISGWTTDGRVGICSYNAGNGYPGPSDPGPPNRGANFFWGGGSAASSMNQVVSLAASATQIDAGSFPFTFSAYLGGYAGDQDAAKATLTFLNQAGAAVGTAIVLGPVTPTDRAGKTGLLLRTNSGSVPTGARSARVTLDFTRASGESNDGYADDISLVVGTGGGPAGSTTDVVKVDGGTFEVATGFNQGGIQGYFTNRLTPASYPATLKKVIIQFPASGAPLNGLPLGSAIQLLSASTTGSGTQLNNVTLTRTSATVTGFNTFVEYDVPALTLSSAGSFLVGFTVLNPVGVFPALVDVASQSAQRSYISTDGATFYLYDSLQGVRPGNFAIRARVEYGAAGGGGGATPALLPLRLSPSPLTFSATEAGTTKIVRADNPNTQTVTVTRVSSSDPNFVSAAVLPKPIGSGSFEFIQIRFAPTGTGPSSGTITIETDPPSAGVALAVSGVSSGSGSGGGGGTSTKVTPNSIAAWPNARTADNVPANAIDGSITTFTWTTPAFNSVAPSYLGIGFAAASSINRIRLYKDNDSGGAGAVAKNLTIEYTTSPASTPLSQRTWSPVSGLTNGFNGTEFLVAASVNSNGTVSADNHDSLRSGWASLTFTAVNATGIRIGFSNVTTLAQNHYRVYEFEAYGGGSSGGTLTVTPATVARGGQATVAWSSVSTDLRDNWVGLYAENAVVGSDNLLRPTWDWVTTVSGSKVFTAPTTPGRYVFWYFLDGGYSRAAVKSNVFTVQ